MKRTNENQTIFTFQFSRDKLKRTTDDILLTFEASKANIRFDKIKAKQIRLYYYLRHLFVWLECVTISISFSHLSFPRSCHYSCRRSIFSFLISVKIHATHKWQHWKQNSFKATLVCVEISEHDFFLHRLKCIFGFNFFYLFFLFFSCRFRWKENRTKTNPKRICWTHVYTNCCLAWLRQAMNMRNAFVVPLLRSNVVLFRYIWMTRSKDDFIETVWPCGAE